MICLIILSSINSIGDVLALIFALVLLGGLIILIVSLIGLLTDTRYRLRGSNTVINIFKTPSEKRKEAENKVASQHFAEIKELEDIVYKYQDRVYQETKTSISLRLATMAYNQKKSFLEAIRRTTFLKDKGLITNPYYETTVKQIISEFYYQRSKAK